MNEDGKSEGQVGAPSVMDMLLGRAGGERAAQEKPIPDGVEEQRLFAAIRG